MPKAQKRRRAPARGSTSQSRIANAKQGTSNGRAASTVVATEPASVNRRFISPAVSRPQSLILPGLVAVGFWLMAYTFMFLNTDPNRFLIGGFAMLNAL